MEITQWQNCTCIALVGKNDGSVALNGRHVDFFYERIFSSELFRAFESIDSEAEVLDGGVCDGMKDICWN